MGEMRLVLIEADSAVTQTLAVALSINYELFTASNGEIGLKYIIESLPDIILLDNNLPDITGVQLISRIKQIGVKAPILVLGDNPSLKTKLDLFNAGADDYILKPFSLGELKARLAVNERRVFSYMTAANNLKTSNLLLDRVSRTVSRDGGRTIRLRPKEYDILECLVINVGHTVSQHTLATHAWKNLNQPWSNAIAVHIKHLRDKIDSPYDIPLITTIHGFGYRLEAV
ncbi:MAG TPA: response regulator transcription factor [Candidatus Saccharimonadales bacterium]